MTKFKVGDYIWHHAGPVGWGVATYVCEGAVQYNIILYDPRRKTLSIMGGDRYTCEEPAVHMALSSEEEVCRRLLAGGELEKENAR